VVVTALNAQWVSGLAGLHDKGFVPTGLGAELATSPLASQPGEFAVVNVRAGSVMRIASSAGEGSRVISKVPEFDSS
jgi:hypothetical protein